MRLENSRLLSLASESSRMKHTTNIWQESIPLGYFSYHWGTWKTNYCFTSVGHAHKTNPSLGDHLDSDSHWSEWFPSALHFLVNQKAGLGKALLQFLRDRHPHLSPGCFKPAASSCGQMTGVPFSSQQTLRKQIWRAEWKSRQHTLQTYLKVYSWVFEIKP